MNFSQGICNYTKEGRGEIHTKLKSDIITEIHKLTKSIYEHNTVELADNKLSKYSAQKGKCSITSKFLRAGDVEIHHIKPTRLGGTDEFKNLTAIHKSVHKLIHATTTETIERYMNELQLNVKQLKKLNKYRKECNLINLV